MLLAEAPDGTAGFGDESPVPKVIANPQFRPRVGCWCCRTGASPAPSQGTAWAAGPEYAGILFSKDDGYSWIQSGHLKLPGSHLTEGTLAETSPSSLLMMLCRSKGWAYESQSLDGGVS